MAVYYNYITFKRPVHVPVHETCHSLHVPVHETCHSLHVPVLCGLCAFLEEHSCRRCRGTCRCQNTDQRRCCLRPSEGMSFFLHILTGKEKGATCVLDKTTQSFIAGTCRFKETDWKRCWFRLSPD